MSPVSADIGRPRVLVMGSGDMGSAVAHTLFNAGISVALADLPQPAHTRRGMAFADALWDGHASLNGVSAQRVDDVSGLKQILHGHQSIPITSLPLETLRGSVPWDVLVNALMRKRDVPDDWRGVARQCIGLGVGFEPGRNCDVAIETSWEDLGRIVTQGRTLPLRGEPRLIAGVGRERNVYAPHAGIVTTEYKIGDVVTAGEAVLTVGPTLLRAPLAGLIRGLARKGVAVARGNRVLEIDPRGEPQRCFGCAERPLRVAEAVKSLFGAPERFQFLHMLHENSNPCQ